MIQQRGWSYGRDERVRGHCFPGTSQALPRHPSGTDPPRQTSSGTRPLPGFPAAAGPARDSQGGAAGPRVASESVTSWGTTGGVLGTDWHMETQPHGTARHGSGRGRDARPGRQMAPGTRRELREEGAEEGDARRGGVRGGLSGLTGEDVCGCGVGAIHLFRAITSHPSITIREKSLPRLPLQLRWGGPSPATGINLERAALSSRAGPTCRAASPRHSSPNCHWSGLPSSVQKDKRYIRCESYLLQWDVLLQHG